MTSTKDRDDDEALPGQTARKTVQVRANDGRVFAARVYRCVDAAADPHLSEALLTGELFEVTPGEGGESYRLALPVRYHDPERELFALVVPEELRHREFELRAELLGELARCGVDLPAYMRAFETVVGVDQLGELLRRAEEASPADDEAATSSDSVLYDGDARGELEEERTRLEKRRTQIEEAEERLEREREELAQTRSELEAMKLNLQQERMRLEQGEVRADQESTQVVTDSQLIEVSEREEEGGDPEESTQVVTDSQFIEVVDRDDVSSTVRTDSPYRSPTELPSVRISRRGVDAAPDFEFESGRRVLEIEGEVVAACTVSAETLEALVNAERQSFFVQYDAEHGYPLVCLLLAGLDDEQREVVSLGWTLDAARDEHRQILEALEGSVELTIVLMGRDDQPAACLDVAAPLHKNLTWIVGRVDEELEAATFDADAYQRAASSWCEGRTGRLGTMRHNFAGISFEEAQGPADIALAAGIVGFWSTPERFEYLVADRSFPLHQFERIQRYVIERAVEQGLYIDQPLRVLAVEMGLSDDERELVERLISEFAEVNVGLRDNDLDPLQEWENWEALVDAAEQLGLEVDPEVLELAEASFKRARDFQQTSPAQ